MNSGANVVAQAVSREKVISKFLKEQAKGKDWLGRVSPKMQTLAEGMIAAFEDAPKTNVRERRKFVREYATQEAVGNGWLALLLPLIIPILQKLLENWLLSRKVA